MLNKSMLIIRFFYLIIYSVNSYISMSSAKRRFLICYLCYVYYINMGCGCSSKINSNVYNTTQSKGALRRNKNLLTDSDDRIEELTDKFLDEVYSLVKLKFS